MTGPEHYREAERLVMDARDVPEFDNERIRYCHAAAQVHATLALVAAHVDGLVAIAANDVAWAEVTS